MTLKFTAIFANRLDMLRCIQQQEQEQVALKEGREVENEQNQQHILSLRQAAQDKADEIIRLNCSYSSEVEQLKLQVRHLDFQNQLLVTKNKSDHEEFKAKSAAHEAQTKENAKAFEDTDTQRLREIKGLQTRITDLEAQATQLSRESESLTNNKQQLVTEITQLKLSTNNLQHETSTLKAESSRKDTELQIKSKLLDEKDSIMSGMSEQLTKARQYLSSNRRVSNNFRRYMLV